MTTPPSDPTPPGPELPSPPPVYTPPPDPWAMYGGRPQQYAAAPRQPHLAPDEPSRTMAGWALGLAIVPCCFGLTTLVGIGLAITVLVKSRHGVNHGKGLAIAALIVGACWIVVNIVAAAAGVYSNVFDDADRDSTGTVTHRDDIAVVKIRTGDCIDYPDLFSSSNDEEVVAAATVKAIPCGQGHQFEAYRTFDLAGDSYPGDEQVERLAAEGCFSAFRTFVGKPYGRSDLEPYILYPKSTAWRVMDDHQVTCLVGLPGELTTGTLEHSRK